MDNKKKNKGDSLCRPRSWLLGRLRVAPLAKAEPAQLSLLMADNASVETSSPPPAGFSQHEHGELWIGVVGAPVCPLQTSFDKLLVDFVRSGDTSFTSCAGSWTAIVYDRASRAFTLISDCMGSWPLFTFKDAHGDVHFTTDATELIRRGVMAPTLDPDALATWMWFGYSIADRALWRDANLLLPASAMRISADGSVTERFYVGPNDHEPVRSRREARERFHDVVGAYARAITEQSPKINVALSGGLDSRYLLAQLLHNRRADSEIVLTTIDEDGEAAFARPIAEAAGLDVDILPSARSQVDDFGDFFHLAPDGYVIGKHGTYFAARHHPGTPLLQGFLGDVIIRIGRGRELDGVIVGKSNPSQVFADLDRVAPLGLLDKQVAAAARERCIACIERMSKRDIAGQVSQTYHILCRQRRLLPNNYLQHADTNAAYVPILAWPFIAQYLHDSYEYMDDQLYQELFDLLPGGFGQLPKFATPSRIHVPGRFARGQARAAAGALYDPALAGLFDRSWALPRIAAAALGRTHFYVADYASTFALQAQALRELVPGFDASLRDIVLS